MVVGTDTAVGKTIFTGLLCKYLQINNIITGCFKPFCSGGTNDIEFLKSCGAEGKVNLWYEKSPISPGAWELRFKKDIDFHYIVSELLCAFEKNEFNLIEGVGGLLAPLSKENKTVATLCKLIDANIILVATNRVGVINHILLTLETALARNITISCVVLMDPKEPDASVIDNAELVRMHRPKAKNFHGVFEFPWLGESADDPTLIDFNLKKAEGVLGEIIKVLFLPSLGRNTSVFTK